MSKSIVEVKQVLTAYDRAKYPFMKEAVEKVREKGIDFEELEQDDFYLPFLDRAEKRVEDALRDVISSAKIKPANEISVREKEIETFSFPLAVMLTVGTEDSFIKSRFALAEAKRASTLLKDEEKETLRNVANNFDWNVEGFGLDPYVFAVSFPVFLKNATGFHDKRWKLVNQKMVDGEVYLTKQKASRLLEEEVRKYVESRLDTKIKYLPPGIMARVTRLRQLAAEKQEQIKREEMPDRVVMEAFPTCIKGVYERVSAGRPASHIGRFALTSFMLNIGMSEEDVFKFFRSVSDFNERMTRYQVEHIGGTRGSGTKYTPPNCSTLRTHGICISPEPECDGAVNPLVCYKKKLKKLPEEKPVEEK